jgi:hypothetical protein
MTNNTTTKVNNMTKKFLTAKETENMTLEQFAAAIRAGKIEVKPEFSHQPTREEVTMNGRYGCE